MTIDPAYEEYNDAWAAQQALIDEPIESPDEWDPEGLDPDEQPINPDHLGRYYAGLSHEVSGKAGSGKTMAVLHDAWILARAGHHVAWIDWEMGKRLLARRLIDALHVNPDEIAELSADPATRRFHYIRGARIPMTSGHFRRIERLNAEWIGIDAATGAYDAYGLDPNVAQDVEKLDRLLVGPLKRTGAATVTIDHYGKDVDRGTAGSFRKEASVDVRYAASVIEAYNHGKGTTKLRVTRDRPFGIGLGIEYHYRLRPSGMIVTRIEHSDDPASAFRRTFYMEKVSRALETEDLSTTRVGKVSNTEYCREALATLVAEKYVVGYVQGNANMYRSLRPYRETSDPQSDKFDGS